MAHPSISLSVDDLLRGESVALGAFEKSAPEAGRLARRLARTLQKVDDQVGWTGKRKQVVRTSTGGSAPRIVEIRGLGKRADFDDRRLGQWIVEILSSAASEGRRELMLVLPDHPSCRGRHALRVLLEILGSGYHYDQHLSRKAPSSLRKVYLVPTADEDDSYRSALRLARAIARGIRTSRDLGNTPPNQATPKWLAEQVRKLADKRGLTCEILRPAELREKGMGGILAVGGGSAHEPRLVRVEWGEGDEVTALVGKGVTFDTGGISIKPAAGMEEMKYDKCGACAVIGAVDAIVGLRLPGRFRAFLPLAENMPDGRSYRPSDIVRCYNGKTVEIHNTDAEGRMILADALAWAAEEKPDNLIELSTLTGATVVALGSVGAALYTPDDTLAQELLAAGESSGEWLWRMPLWPEFTQQMRGVHADLKNLGSRWGGANNAAAFLGQFVGRTRRWAHLDIAGTAYLGTEKGAATGATGFGVALITDWLLQRTGRF